MTGSTTSYASSSPPPPTYDPQPSRRYAPAATDGDGGFDAALRDVHGHDGEADDHEVRRSDKRGDDDKKKKRKGDGEGETASTAAAAHGGKGGATAQARSRTPEGKTDILSGLMQHPGGMANAAADEAQAPSVNQIDPAQFAQMLEQAAARAEPVQVNQTIQISFNDFGSPLQQVQVTRLPDGSLSMTLTATEAAVPEVSRTLESLRRRLEAKGVSLGELKLAEEKDLAPEAIEAADAS